MMRTYKISLAFFLLFGLVLTSNAQNRRLDEVSTVPDGDAISSSKEADLESIKIELQNGTKHISKGYSEATGELGLGDLERPALHIWPNPASWVLNVEIPENMGNHVRIRIRNQRGEIVSLVNGIPGAVSVIEVTTLPPGVYIVDISGTGGGNKTRGLLGHFIRD